MQTARKLLAMLLCLVMVLSFFPAAYAEGEDEGSIAPVEEQDHDHEHEGEEPGTIAPTEEAPVGDGVLDVPEESDIVEADGASTDYTLSGNLRDDIIAVAAAQEGKTAADFGFSVAWCSYFVSWCGRIAAPDLFPSTLQPYGKDLVVNMANNRKGILYYFDDAAYTSLNNGDPYVNYSTGSYIRTDRSSFVPEPGDLITFSNDEYEFKHIGIVCGVDSNNVYYIDGNGGGASAGTTMTRPVRTFVPIARDSDSISTYLRPNYEEGKETGIINTVNVSIDDPSVFLKQEPGSKQCTLIANVMMLRRRAIIDGNSAWDSITGESVGNTAWSSSGMAFDYNYGGKHVYSYGMSSELNLSLGDLNGKKQYLIENLTTHPEGIVIYVHHSSSYKHAVLLTDYDAATDTFYCADPAPSIASGRIKLADSLLPHYVKQSYPNTGLSDQNLVIAYTQQTWMIIEGSGPIEDPNPPAPGELVSMNDPSVFLKGDTRTTLITNTMMLRRRAILDGDSAWSEITTDAVAQAGWVDGSGMSFDYTYGGKRVYSYGMSSELNLALGDLSARKTYFINNLVSHPEGIVLYVHFKTDYKNCVLLTDYDAVTDTFYCADPCTSSGSGRIRLADSILPSCIKQSYPNTGLSDQDLVIAYAQQTWMIIKGSGATTTYTVSFNANGGTGAPAALTKTRDVPLTLSTTKPTRSSSSAGSYTVTLSPQGGSVSSTSLTAARTTNYSFKNWNTAANGSGTNYASGASYTANADATLYAQWNSTTSTAAVTLPTPIRTGYGFQGWNTKADGTGTKYNGGSSYTPSANVTLYAIWQANTYTVSYDANGGTGAPANQIKTYGVDLTLSTTKPTRANASAGSYTVTLDPQGGSVSSTSLTAARTTSYSFKNWNTAANGSGTSYASGASYTANAAATLYAQWNSTTSTAAVTLPTPSRTGYSFQGWNTEADGTGTSYNGGASYTPSANVTLYAIWQADTYTISYDANGGTGAPGNQIKTYGVDLTLSSTKPTRGSSSAGSYTVTLEPNGGSVSSTSLTAARTTSYSFRNWNTKADGSGTSYASGASYTANAGATLYAQWNSTTSTAAVTLPTPSRTGYSFQGWNTKADGTGTSYNGGASYTPTADGTLYAIWQKDAPETDAKLIVGGGKARPGEEIQVPITLEKNPGVVSIELSVVYDETVLEWVGVSAGNYGGSFDGKVGKKLTWFAEDPRENETKDDVFATLRFRVKEDAAEGSTFVSVSYEEDYVYNSDEENQAFAVVPGEIVIYNYLPGDINGDGMVNNKDVTRLMRYIKYGDIEVVEAALDVNGDGSVNNKDVTRLMRYIKYGDVEIH